MKVEKGIPIPSKGINQIGNKNNPQKYPWCELTEAGDSFLVPVAADMTKKQIESLQSSVSGCGLRKKIKITTRQVKGGIRVWRVE